MRAPTIHVELSAPPWRPASVGPAINFSSEATAYSHRIQVGGGYRSAEIEVSATDFQRDYIIKNMVGARVRATGPGNVTIWSGYVNTIEVPLGGTTFTIGPFLEIANRVKVTYSTKRYDTTPPIGGAQQETAYANDLYSQKLYGVREVVVSGGEGDATTMSYLRDNYLKDNAHPKVAPQLNPFGQGQNSGRVRLSCVGAFDLLDGVTYSNVDGTTDNPIEDILLAILQAEPNEIFDIVEAFLQASGISIPSFTDVWDFETILALLKEAMAWGGSTDRYYIGVFGEGVSLRYEKIPAKVEYLWDTRSAMVTDLSGRPVPPWLVQPAKWVMISDVLPSLVVPDYGIEQLRQNPAAAFIESVDYTAPYDLELGKTSLSALRETLSDMGLAGRW